MSPPMSLSSTMNSRQTFCHQYLSRFVDISDKTIDIMVRNGFYSVNTLRAIDMDRDWNHLPSEISIAQKVLLRKALAKLADDDYVDDKQDLTARQSVSNKPVVINSDNKIDTVSDSNGKSYNNNIEVKNKNKFRYQRNDSTNRQFKCNYKNCDKSFRSKKSLSQHKKNVHSIRRPYNCNYKDCYKSFKERQLLCRHQKEFHSTDRPFICNYKDCNKSFKFNQDMSQHKKMFHSIRRPFVCNNKDSDKSFKNKANRQNRHQKTIYSNHQLISSHRRNRSTDTMTAATTTCGTKLTTLSTLSPNFIFTNNKPVITTIAKPKVDIKPIVDIKPDLKSTAIITVID
ncbi:putative zinc finger protein 840 [Oppia nitens]|uniref:putative zinc finger protein 840 n=1 Tax=Oppia nitens TaxID=1686743 RepID=UPI0023DAF84E|nr:putative zinc finger protein 840 [Oppia nitens]